MSVARIHVSNTLRRSVFQYLRRTFTMQNAIIRLNLTFCRFMGSGRVMRCPTISAGSTTYHGTQLSHWRFGDIFLAPGQTLLDTGLRPAPSTLSSRRMQPLHISTAGVELRSGSVVVKKARAQCINESSRHWDNMRDTRSLGWGLFSTL